MLNPEQMPFADLYAASLFAATEHEQTQGRNDGQWAALARTLRDEMRKRCDLNTQPS